MTISAEAIEQIGKLAVDAEKTQVVKALDSQGQLIVATAPNRKTEVLTLDPVPRSHALHSLDSLVAFAQGVQDLKHRPGGNAAIWVGRHAIEVVVDDATRRDTASLETPFTPQLDCLLRTSSSHRVQREFLKLLTINLHDCLPADSGLISKVREVRWKDSGEMGATLKHGAESIDRQVRQAIQGTDAIPDEITISVRVYQCPDIRDKVQIRCAIDIDVESKAFALIPLPMQIEDAVDGVLDGIVERIQDTIKDKGVPVYRGKP